METGNRVMRPERWRHMADCIIEWKNIPHHRSNYPRLFRLDFDTEKIISS